jgi:DNA ligase (NAD+)
MLKQTIKILNNARDKYYNEGSSDLSDSEFDILEDKLRQKDPNNEYFNKVGFIPKIKEIHHEIPMLSCNKVHTIENLYKWYDWCKGILNKNINMIVEHKIDGCSGDIKYVKGKLNTISTRGNGYVGYEIKNDGRILGLPKWIPILETIHIRGEFVIFKTDKNKGLPLRNICAGALKRDTYDDTYDINFVAYDIVPYSRNKIKMKNKTWIDKTLISLADMGFETVGYNYVPYYDRDCLEIQNEYLKIRDKLKYETDGLIFYIDSELYNDWEILDKEKVSDHHHQYMIALKPPPTGAWTILKDIEWQVGRSGRITPIGILEPCNIGSVTVNRVTLHNISFIKVNDILINDKVMITRNGDVIPGFLYREHTPDSKPIKELKVCPVCGHKIRLDKNKVNYICINTKCKAQLLRHFMHWFESCDIPHMGERMLEQFLEITNFKAIWQLYAIPTNDLIQLIEKACKIGSRTPKMREFRAKFDTSRGLSQANVLSLYGIPKIGSKTISRLKLKNIKDLKDFMTHDVSNGLIEKELKLWLSNNDNFEDLERLMVLFDDKEIVSNKNLFNYCITGEFEESRSNIQKKIKSIYNWNFIPSVTKECKLLIVGNKGQNTSKYKAAIKLNVPLIQMGNTLDYEALGNI